MGRDPELLRQLLDSDVLRLNVDQASDEGTPLCFAISRRFLDGVKILLDKGADLEKLLEVGSSSTSEESWEEIKKILDEISPKLYSGRFDELLHVSSKRAPKMACENISSVTKEKTILDEQTIWAAKFEDYGPKDFFID
ncbi:hypothetical protein ABW20_dc0107586 [Dactylellina cionopaga]|nr:hypothetical protein ABW20_dc0107586 [Dactylellina cionopaga]